MVKPNAVSAFAVYTNADPKLTKSSRKRLKRKAKALGNSVKTAIRNEVSAAKKNRKKKKKKEPEVSTPKEPVPEPATEPTPDESDGYISVESESEEELPEVVSLDEDTVPELVPIESASSESDENSDAEPTNHIAETPTKPIYLEATSSVVSGQSALNLLLQPQPINQFITKYWEKAPLHVPNKGDKKLKYSNLISTEMIDEWMRSQAVVYGRDLDVTSYADGVRETLSSDGLRAHAHVVWDYYRRGCSIRLLQPHSMSKNLCIFNATLQEYFGAYVGSNVYLTPPNSQGFAPHFDDIEAFVIQIEGSKHWKVYSPRTHKDVLPRYSSPNFTEADLEAPILEVTLKPGDVLYFPRGFVHQAHTVRDEHSLHVTISVYQKTAWVDLLENMLPQILERAAATDVEFRRGLPIGYLRQAGFGFGRNSGRKALIQKCKSLVSKLENYVDVDGAVDAMGMRFMREALPPALNLDEAVCSVYENGWRMSTNGELTNQVQITVNTKVRFVRAHSYRLVVEDVKNEDDSVQTDTRLYHTCDNSTGCRGEPPSFLSIIPEYVDAIRVLVHNYPQFTRVGDLPCSSDKEKVSLVVDLWEEGVVITNTPLEPVTEPTLNEDSEDSDAWAESNGGKASTSVNMSSDDD